MLAGERALLITSRRRLMPCESLITCHYMLRLITSFLLFHDAYAPEPFQQRQPAFSLFTLRADKLF